MSIDVFISYSPVDDGARRTLETHLSALQRSRFIRTWTAHQIGPGQEERAAIDKRLDEAHLILLLISPDFLASDYYYDVEMKRALERHRAGLARVVPIIVRHVDWRGTHIDGLMMLPENARPVSSAGWGSIDKAWTNVAVGLRVVVEEMMGSAPSHSPPSGRSFVEARRSYTSTPPQSAPSFVAPSSRASHPGDPSSNRLPMRSRPEMASPVSSHRLSQRSTAWTGAPTLTRVPSTPRSSRLPLLAALVFAVSGVGFGVWAITQPTPRDTGIPNLNSMTTVAPPLPAPSPSPTPTLKSDPAPAPPPVPSAVGGACCGGVGCNPDLRDTQGTMCATLDDHCAVCRSLRDKVEGSCRTPIDPSKPFLLRLARLDLSGVTLGITRVCVRLGGAPTTTRQCTLASDASDTHPGKRGVEVHTRLLVSVADLIDGGRGLDIDVETAGRPPISRRGLILKGPDLFRSALCAGVTHKVGEAHVSFFLDD